MAVSSELKPFWQQSLEALTSAQWEQLCDGCGRCCVVRYQDEDSGEIVESNEACVLLDCGNCRCSDYNNRFQRVPECTEITLEYLADSQLRSSLPPSCAYRLRAEGKPLPAWHPLITGDPNSVIEAGISVAGLVVPYSGDE